MLADRTPDDFGSTLRQARERRGVSLRQIATATKISVAALEGLERNDITRLPGGIFSRAFVRSYAIEVGLDPDKTIQQFIASFPNEVDRRGTAAAGRARTTRRSRANAAPPTTFLRLDRIERSGCRWSCCTSRRSADAGRRTGSAAASQPARCRVDARPRPAAPFHQPPRRRRTELSTCDRSRRVPTARQRLLPTRPSAIDRCSSA